MKRKYYKYTDAYCRHLEFITHGPSFRFQLPFFSGRPVKLFSKLISGYQKADGSLVPMGKQL